MHKREQRVRVVPAALVLAVGTLACAVDGVGAEDGLSGGDGIVGTGGPQDTGAGPPDADAGDGLDDGLDDGSKYDVNASDPLPDDGSDGDPSECATVSEQADFQGVPADIIFVVDNSTSMATENGAVQAHLNAFSQQIIDSGVDARVVLVSRFATPTLPGICIEPPLGSGGCPDADTNPPLYTHVPRAVASRRAWPTLLEEHPNWQPAVRDDAQLHIVVMTDDESSMWEYTFYEAMLELDPGYEGYVHHSVVCHSQCPNAYAIGEAYIDHTQQTGGVAADLCDEDYSAVFDALATEVISGAALGCAWEIPAPPNGMVFDPDAVNLAFSDGDGGEFEVGAVPSARACGDVDDGWYYDDPDDPTSIEVCPQTCAHLQTLATGSIDITFGCATVPAPPAG